MAKTVKAAVKTAVKKAKEVIIKKPKEVVEEEISQEEVEVVGHFITEPKEEQSGIDWDAVDFRKKKEQELRRR